MTGALPKWEAALDTFDRIKHNFRAPGQIEKALNSIALDERVLLFRGSDLDIVERLSPYDRVEGTLDSTGGHGRDVSAEGISSSDLVKLRGKVKVLKKGDPETGDTKSISLYRSGDDPPSLKNKDGHLAGRLYLKNVNIMVPADTAMVEVVAPTREIRPPFLPEENSNGLSEELFAFDSVIRVSSYTGLSLVDDFAQDITSCLVNAFPTLIGPYLAWRQQFVHSKPD
ncbi:hypothetical protein ABBQ38_014031 [Trebouxia sp. C0009 RCD-2024]